MFRGVEPSDVCVPSRSPFRRPGVIVDALESSHKLEAHPVASVHMDAPALQLVGKGGVDNQLLCGFAHGSSPLSGV
jgi:hypothetical protein